MAESIPAVLDIEGLYQSTYREFLRLAYLLCGEITAAEDCVQDAFMRLADPRNKLREPRAASAYLRACIVNRSRSAHRRKQSARRYLPQLLQSDLPGADVEVVGASRDSALRKAVDSLPRRQREVIVLRFWAGMGTRQVAECLGLSEGTVKTCSHRALVALEESMEGYL